MNDIAAIVVTYNRKQMLAESIEALRAQGAADRVDIIVIDNASTDGTYESIKSLHDCGAIKYINTGANLGGAGGFSYGIRYAAENDYDYVWVMDDDCIPKSGALQAFLDFDSRHHGSYGFLSSKVLWKDGSINQMNIQRRTLTRPLRNFKETTEIAMASFVSLFVPVPVIKELGLPIKEFFIWTDDWEFTRRISRVRKGYFVPSSVVVHKSKTNIGANIATDSLERLSRYRYLYRNDVYLYRREGIKGFGYEAARLTWHVARVLAYSRNKSERIRMIINGTREGLSFKPDIEFADKESR